MNDDDVELHRNCRLCRSYQLGKILRIPWSGHGNLGEEQLLSFASNFPETVGIQLGKMLVTD